MRWLSENEIQQKSILLVLKYYCIYDGDCGLMDV